MSGKGPLEKGPLESDVQPLIRLALSRAGCNMYRNNIGLAWYGANRDQPVRYGLVEGSGDLIGYTPVVITSDMVGKTIAVFTSVEVKRPKGGTLKDSQKNFIIQVLKHGGFAGFARSVAEALEIISGRGLT